MTPPAKPREIDKRPSQYELHTAVIIDLGRKLNTADTAVLAAAFWQQQQVAPNPAALDIAHLILIGEEEL